MVVVAAVLALLLATTGVLALTGQGPWADDPGTVAMIVPSEETGSNGETGSSTEAPAEAEEEAVDAYWTAASLTPVLDDIADDESEDWSYFDADAAVPIPCGGEGAQGAGADVLETTVGGAQITGAAEIFADEAAAEREMARLRSLLEGCGPHDYVMTDGTVLSACSAPDVTTLDPVIRFGQSCEEVAGGIPAGQVTLRSGNAVISLIAGGAGAPDLDVLLSSLLDGLESAASGNNAGGAGTAGGVVSDDFINDWNGTATGSLSGAVGMQVGQYDATGGPSRVLTGDIAFRDLGCYGQWDEDSRDATSVTIIAVMSGGGCGEKLTMTLRLDGSGRLVVAGDSWTATLDPEY